VTRRTATGTVQLAPARRKGDHTTDSLILPGIELAEGRTGCPNRYTPPWLRLLSIGSALNITLLLIGFAAQAQITQPIEKVTSPTLQFAFVTPSVSIQNSFTLSYGQTATVCANVTPLSEFAQVSFVSDPLLTLEIQKTLQSCSFGNFTGNITLTVRSLTNNLCSPEGNIRARLRLGQKAADQSGNPAESSGVIMLPTSETSSFSTNLYCSQYHDSAGDTFIGPGGAAAWTLTFASQGNPTANFNDVQWNETQQRLTVGQIPQCSQFSYNPSPGNIGPTNTGTDFLYLCLGTNSNADIVTGCGDITTQQIFAGQCFVGKSIQNRHFWFNNGYFFDTYRSDPNAVSLALPQP
jgi:hypothetical protein